ncbi:RNA-guided endonuclease InsQ/TnpB family protein [Moraxella sp. ZJ142]|uniref:RNA-guided endonuclease InsQ/TnpB family protein n=1 Tax=Moraxella marmotae TaxID=3344520 RepID=UPI0035D42537
MIRGQYIQLKPNNKQATHLAKACGVARFAYNWGLEQWQKQYQQDKEYRDECARLGVEIDKTKLNRPTEGKLRKQLNAIKRDEFPFMMDVTKCAPQIAIMQLGSSFDRFFKGDSKYPRFRKKGVDDRFSLTNDLFTIVEVDGKPFIKLPRLGLVRLCEKLRLDGKILNGKVYKKADKWFVSITVELAEPIKPLAKTGKSIGIDMGISDFAVLSDGNKIQAPKPYKRAIKRLKRAQKSLSRKQKGSNNRAKARTKLARLHLRVSNIRLDFLHKLTTKLVKTHDVICLEDLNVKGMVKNHKLAGSIADLGFYEFKRQLMYKAEQWGRQVKFVDRFFPSSKTCSCCGYKMEKLPLSVRHWTCPSCQTEHDRDVNAAINILNFAT